MGYMCLILLFIEQAKKPQTHVDVYDLTADDEGRGRKVKRTRVAGKSL